MCSFGVAEVLLRLNVTSSLTTLGQLTLQDNNNANALTSDLPLFNFRYLLPLLWGSTRESLLVHFFFIFFLFESSFKLISEYLLWLFLFCLFHILFSSLWFIQVWLYEVKVHYYVCVYMTYLYIVSLDNNLEKHLMHFYSAICRISASLFLFRYAPLSFSNCFLTSMMTLICVLTSSKTT